MNLALYIEHTRLYPDVSRSAIKRLCTEAISHKMFGVVVPPYYLGLARQVLVGTPVQLGTVVGFPYGYDHAASKETSVRVSVRSGASFLNVVVNTAAIKSNKWNYVTDEIHRLASVTRLMNLEHKFIFDPVLLSDDEMEKLCTIMNRENVDFVQLSSVRSEHPVQEEEVVQVRRLLAPSIRIKVAALSMSRMTAIRLIKSGADRIGTKKAMQVLNQHK